MPNTNSLPRRGTEHNAKHHVEKLSERIDRLETNYAPMHHVTELFEKVGGYVHELRDAHNALSERVSQTMAIVDKVLESQEKRDAEAQQARLQTEIEKRAQDKAIFEQRVQAETEKNKALLQQIEAGKLSNRMLCCSKYAAAATAILVFLGAFGYVAVTALPLVVEFIKILKNAF